MGIINIDRMTNDPTYEYYAYGPRRKTVNLLRPMLWFLSIMFLLVMIWALTGK